MGRKTLSAEDKKLRSDIARINKRLQSFDAAGLDSPAANRLLTTLGLKKGQTIKIGGKTKSEQQIIKAAIKRFLGSKTATKKGIKIYQELRKKRIKEYFSEQMGIADEKKLDNALKGANSFAEYAAEYSISSRVVAATFAEGADAGLDAGQIERLLDDRYNNDNIDNTDIDDDYGF